MGLINVLALVPGVRHQSSVGIWHLSPGAGGPSSMVAQIGTRWVTWLVGNQGGECNCEEIGYKDL